VTAPANREIELDPACAALLLIGTAVLLCLLLRPKRAH